MAGRPTHEESRSDVHSCRAVPPPPRVQWDGGTFAEFESNLPLNAFETTIKDRSGDLVHALVGGVADLHQSGGIDLGAHAQIDYRILQVHGARQDSDSSRSPSDAMSSLLAE